MSIRDFLAMDPADQVKFMPSQVIRKKITYADATQTIGTIPANSVILSTTVVRTTKWNSAPTTFEVGKSGTTSWLMTTTQANVSGNIPSGEDAGVERREATKAVTSDTPVIVTLSQGSASAGVAYVLVEYQEVLNL